MQKYQNVVTNQNGASLAGMSVLVQSFPSGSTPVIYSDNGITPAANPLTTDPSGNFAFYAADGHYQLQVSGLSVPAVSVLDIILQDAVDGTVPTFTQPSAGAVTRTVVARALDAFYAADAGASTALSDNSTALANAIASGKTVRLPDATYNLTNFAQSLTLPLSIKGDSKAKTTLVQNSAVTNSILSNSGVTGTRISDMTLQTPNSVAGSNGHPISLIDVNDVTVRDVDIQGLGGSGSAIIVYPNVNATVNDIRIENVNATGNLANATNNNGPLIVNGTYCMMRGIHADSINEFAVEYKNATVHSLSSDIIVSNSYNGLTYGNTTTPGTQYSAASNVVSYNCGAAVEYGIGSFNVLANLVVHNTQTWPTNGLADGVRFEAGSNSNSVSNALFAGTFNQPVHTFGNGNYLSGSFQNTGFGVTLESGAAQNVAAVNHPGARSSIYASFVQDASGQSLSGSNSNPTYCHATGEYLGSLSGGWRWVQSRSGFSGSLGAEQKWVYETTGNGSITVLSDALGSNGLEVTSNSGTRSFNYNWASDYWQISGGSASYRFTSSALVPQTTNSFTLGTSGNVWNNVFTTFATISGALSTRAPSLNSGASISMGSGDSSLIFTGSANQTLTLLNPATWPGRILYVKNTVAFTLSSASSNVVPLGSTTAGTAILAAGPGKFAMLQSDGTNWITMMSN